MGASQFRFGFKAVARASALAGLCLMLANCASSDKFARKVDPKYGVSASERVVEYGEPVPKGGGKYRVGKPYVVAGQVYTPEEDKGYVAEGLASWYGDDFHGRRTANGELFDMDSLTAAHPTLPMPSYVRVTNLKNRKSVIVRVNDRGPYHNNRLIDVSRRVATLLDFHNNGVARVRVEYVGQASLDGSDDRLLAATLREGEPAPAPSAVRLASARPFLPPSRGGDVPLPQGRPYTLGEDVPSVDVPSRAGNAQASVPMQSRTQVASAGPVESIAPRKVQTTLVHTAKAAPVQTPTQKPAHVASAAPQMRLHQQATADVAPASMQNPEAGLMPRSLGEQAHDLSGSSFAQRYSGSQGLQQLPSGSPGGVTAFAPVRGLY